jgi:hypothetical protein
VEFRHVSAFADESPEVHGGAVIRLDPRLIDESWPLMQPVSIHDNPLPFRFWLHRLLGREGLTCELDGETLLILREEPEE